MQGKGTRRTENKDDQIGITGLGSRHQAPGENVINVINVGNPDKVGASCGELECDGMWGKLQLMNTGATRFFYAMPEVPKKDKKERGVESISTSLLSL
jgi:hypothetical protein